MLIVEKTRRLAAPRPRTAHAPLCEKDAVKAQATARLQRSPYAELHRVVCEFYEGILRLRGCVPSYYMKQVAQTAVLGLDGVDEIHNQLEVVPFEAATTPDFA